MAKTQDDEIQHPGFLHEVFEASSHHQRLVASSKVDKTMFLTSCNHCSFERDGNHYEVMRYTLNGEIYIAPIEAGKPPVFKKIDYGGIPAPPNFSLTLAPRVLYNDSVFVKETRWDLYASFGSDEADRVGDGAEEGTSAASVKDDPPAKRQKTLENSVVENNFPFDTVDTSTMGLNEVLVLERLLKTPHPHIVRYFGCLVIRGRITGLVFENLTLCLSDYDVAKPEFRDLDVDLFLSRLESTVAFLHGLGLAHNDIKPDNVMIRDGLPVLIDLEGCCPLGTRIAIGTDGWVPPDEEVWQSSRKENDLYGLRMIRERIRNMDEVRKYFRVGPEPECGEQV